MPTLYKAIKVNGVKCDEHRHLMEQRIGRKLARNEFVHHINGVKRDNRIENLEIVDWREHARMHMIERHAAGQGPKVAPERRARGERIGSAKMTEAEVIGIRLAMAAGFGCKSVARAYGIHFTTAQRIKRRLIWAHVA